MEADQKCLAQRFTMSVNLFSSYLRSNHCLLLSRCWKVARGHWNCQKTSFLTSGPVAKKGKSICPSWALWNRVFNCALFPTRDQIGFNGLFFQVIRLFKKMNSFFFHQTWRHNCYYDLFYLSSFVKIAPVSSKFKHQMTLLYPNSAGMKYIIWYQASVKQ